MKCKNLSKIVFAIFIFLWSEPVSVYARDNGNDYGTTDTLSINIDLFNDSEPADITLKFNIRNFLKVKNRDNYVDAIMIYDYGDTLSIKSNIRIKARGKNRREVCMFPPLYININDSQLKNGYLANTEKIKFVTHCVQTKRNNDYVLKEYLLYKMFNLISPYSFRVRLARVKYIDTGRNNREYEDWGFFIEPEEMLALRLDAVPLDIDYIDYNYTEPENTDIMSMFQYIIGNSDYSIRTRQNLKLVKIKDSFSKPIPIPYDFDYSGFVNAYYAIPGDNLGIESVRERYFLGPCRPEEKFVEIFDYMFDLKDKLYSLVESFEYLDKKERKLAISYLDEFFLQARQKRYIRNNLFSTCRDTLK